MTRVLIITSSARGTDSASNQLASHFKESYSKKHPDALFEELDVASESIPHLSADVLAALATDAEQRTAEQLLLARTSETLIEQLLDADIVVVAFGLYNFGIPSSLKAYIDHVARAGHTFRYTSTGPVGLLTEKKLYILAASGGIYTSGPAASMDFGSPYLRTVFAFLGITNSETITAEGLAMQAESARDILARATAKIDAAI